MTDIVDVPQTLPIAPFPALGSPNYNQEAYENGISVPPAIERLREIVDAGRTNAVAATEQALAAHNSRVQAGIEITAIKDAAVSETTEIKDAAVSKTTAIKDAAVSETTAIKDAAVSETTAIKDAAVSETTAIKDAAVISAAAAADSATAARAVANFAGRWDEAVGQMPMGTTVYHLGKFWVSLEALADVTLAEPGASAVWAKAGGGIETIAYDDRATLRTLTAVAGDLVMVDGLGLFVFAAGSDEPDDDESCFAKSSGKWLLECPHWDVVSMWQLPDDAVRDEYDEDEPLRFASSFASKVLSGTATCAITSVATVSSASFTGTVTGASVGDRVIATPPAQLGATAADTGRLSYHAWVSAADTVTVMLTNASAALANTNTAIRTAWPITVIKS